MPAPRVPSYLRSSRFRALSLGQAASSVGNQLTVVVLPALVVPFHGARVYGALLATEAAVMAAFLLTGGVVADRYSRSLVMAASDVLSALGVFGFIVFADHASAVPLLVSAAATGLGAAMFSPAHSAAIAQVIDDEERQRANGFDGSLRRAGSLLGAVLAGLLLAHLAPSTAMLVDVASFAVSLVTLVWLRLPPARAGDSDVSGEDGASPNDRMGVFRQAAVGFREVRKRPWIASIMLQGTFQVFFLFGPNLVLVPTVCISRYGAPGYSLVSAASLIGSVAGSVLGGRLRSGRPGLWAMHALAVCVLTPLCIAVHVPEWTFALCMAAGSTGVGVFMVLWYSALQREIPDEAQGRVYALEELASFGLMPVALAGTPFLVQAFGLTAFATLATAVLLISTYGVLVVPGTARLTSNAPGYRQTRTQSSVGASQP